MMRILNNLNRCLLMTAIVVVNLGNTWSYGDERLLFVRDGGLYTVNPDGSESRSQVEMVVNPESFTARLLPSPNGQWAIVEKPNGDKEVVDLESGVVLVSLWRFVGDLSWSPDSEWIAFQQFGGVFVARRDGSDEKRLADGIGPKWDPLNPQLIYYTHAFDIDGANINVVDIDSGESRVVRPGMHLANVNSPFSPDGRRLLVSDCGDGESCIKILELATGEVTGPIGPSGHNGADTNSPSWSPDGTQLAFTVASGMGGVYVADAAGETSRQLVVGEAGRLHPWGPVWSPAGDLIAFCMRDLTGADNHEIYVIRPDGSGLQKVADGRGTVWWWTGASAGSPTNMRLETWGTIKQDSR